MIEPTMLAALTGIVGAALAAIWSFLMAAKVAAPRAATRSKLLLVNILTGATKEDKEILETIRGSLVRPEVERLMTGMQENAEMEITIPDDQIDALASKMYAMFQGERGNAMRQMQKELEPFTGPINELAEGLMEGARAAQSPSDIALMRLLNIELSPAFKKKNPQLAFMIESGKVTLAQLAEIARQSGLAEKMQGGSASEVPISSGRGSFGVR